MLELLFLMTQLDNVEAVGPEELCVSLLINDETIIVPMASRDCPTAVACQAGVAEILATIAIKRYEDFLEQEPDATWIGWLTIGELDELYDLLKCHFGAPPEDWWAKCKALKPI